MRQFVRHYLNESKTVVLAVSFLVVIKPVFPILSSIQLDF